ncbi:MAG: hypothetical protein ACAI44_25000 [Candidatus Sericytochromatia bacterium]
MEFGSLLIEIVVSGGLAAIIPDVSGPIGESAGKKVIKCFAWFYFETGRNNFESFLERPEEALWIE